MVVGEGIYDGVPGGDTTIYCCPAIVVLYGRMHRLVIYNCVNAKMVKSHADIITFQVSLGRKKCHQKAEDTINL